MKIYSDTLTEDDIHAAIYWARERTSRRLYAFDFYPLPRTRVRRLGWNFRLGNVDSHRRVNSGTRGGGENGAASYDEWGWFLAELFAMDANARAGIYDGLDDFNTRTSSKYLNPMHSCPFCTFLKGQ